MNETVRVQIQQQFADLERDDDFDEEFLRPTAECVRMAQDLLAGVPDSVLERLHVPSVGSIGDGGVVVDWHQRYRPLIRLLITPDVSRSYLFGRNSEPRSYTVQPLTPEVVTENLEKLAAWLDLAPPFDKSIVKAKTGVNPPDSHPSAVSGRRARVETPP